MVPDLARMECSDLQEGDFVLIWGSDEPDRLVEFIKSRGARLLHVEDGFIRSVGLGSDLVPPLSLVFDARGIYYDATRSSDLEILLSTKDFSADELERARKVRDFISRNEITKYNIDLRKTVNWKTHKSIILVPGQVEDDASIRLGCTTIHSNLELLQAVRGSSPDAFIVYKPHPDVLSGNRRGRLSIEQARQYADCIETSVSVISCIEACDEVHTLTSLSGFDALLRGKKVATYGQPFYAGWGLTDDRAENPTAFARRSRRLSVDELVAGVLLNYPMYWDENLKGYTSCEGVLHQILDRRTRAEVAGDLDKLRRGFLRRQLRKLVVVFKSYFLV